MGTKHGNLSINSENIFPIIKKWMYSDHDIFIRELISNGCDAITKLKKLIILGKILMLLKRVKSFILQLWKRLLLKATPQSL